MHKVTPTPELERIAHLIETAWDQPTSMPPQTLDVVQQVFKALDQGQLRVAEKIEGTWVVRAWVKKAILLSFRLFPAKSFGGGYDKIPLKCEAWTAQDFAEAGFRMVPGVVIRQGAFVARNAILMPSFINSGTFIDEGTMIDSCVTVGSCAQIGRKCHISANVCIGGVLEPLQANPVIIEDNCFVGVQSSVVEGVIVEEGAVIGMGVCLGASTPIVNRQTGEISYGRIPPYAVVLPGSLPTKAPATGPTLHLNCAVIVKTVDAKTREKTGINELLRAQ